MAWSFPDQATRLALAVSWEYVLAEPNLFEAVLTSFQIIEGAVEHRQAHNYEKSSAVLHQILDKGVSEEQANADLVVALYVRDSNNLL